MKLRSKLMKMVNEELSGLTIAVACHTITDLSILLIINVSKAVSDRDEYLDMIVECIEKVRET